MVDDFVLIS